jgi:peptidoglycan hydrolase-like protein with peptidoglycan-binding domain
MVEQDPGHFHDPHFQQQARVDLTFNKQQVGTHHSQKNIPELHSAVNLNISVPLPSKFHTNLYKGNQNQSEEDVKILQNTLNVIYHVSISQNKSEEELQNFSHQYLKVDGMYGDKTKNFVMKFQESAQLPIDGIVSELLWKKLVYSYEKIQKDEQAKRDKLKQSMRTGKEKGPSQFHH